MIDSDPEEFQMEMVSDDSSEEDLQREAVPDVQEILSEDSDIPSEEEMQIRFDSASDSDDIERVEDIKEEELAQSDVPESEMGDQNQDLATSQRSAKPGQILNIEEGVKYVDMGETEDDEATVMDEGEEEMQE